jgi:hypothetical protein
MRSLYKRPWFLQRTLHRLHPHDHQKQDLAEAWLLDLEDGAAILPFFLLLGL